MQNPEEERRQVHDSGNAGGIRHLPCGARGKIAIFYLVGENRVCCLKGGNGKGKRIIPAHFVPAGLTGSLPDLRQR